MALETHPDRNPHDPDAASNFYRVQQAYEQILAGHGGTSDTSEITFSIEIQGMGPTACFVIATNHGAVVGSSQGRIYKFGANGSLLEARVLGDGAIRVALREDGALGAVWCDSTLLFLRDGRVTNAVATVDWPQDLIMWGDNVVLWNRTFLKVLDAFGQTLYEVEFSKSIAGVVASKDVLYCAAGALVAFKHRG